MVTVTPTEFHHKMWCWLLVYDRKFASYKEKILPLLILWVFYKEKLLNLYHHLRDMFSFLDLLMWYINRFSKIIPFFDSWGEHILITVVDCFPPWSWNCFWWCYMGIYIHITSNYLITWKGNVVICRATCVHRGIITGESQWGNDSLFA